MLRGQLPAFEALLLLLRRLDDAARTKFTKAEDVAAELDRVFAFLRAGLEAIKTPPAKARR